MSLARDLRDRVDRIASDEVAARTWYVRRFQDTVEASLGLCQGLCLDLSPDILGSHLPAGPGLWRRADRQRQSAGVERVQRAVQRARDGARQAQDFLVEPPRLCKRVRRVHGGQYDRAPIRSPTLDDQNGDRT